MILLFCLLQKDDQIDDLLSQINVDSLTIEVTRII